MQIFLSTVLLRFLRLVVTRTKEIGAAINRRETEVGGVPAGAKHRRPVSSRRTSFPCLASVYPRSSDFAGSHAVPRTTGYGTYATRSRSIDSPCSARPLAAADYASPLSAPTLAPAVGERNSYKAGSDLTLLFLFSFFFNDISLALSWRYGEMIDEDFQEIGISQDFQG